MRFSGLTRLPLLRSCPNSLSLSSRRLAAPTRNLSMASLKQDHILTFSPSWVPKSRGNYYGSGGSGYGGGRGSGGWFQQLKWRIDSINGNTLFYTLVGLNAGVFGLW